MARRRRRGTGRREPLFWSRVCAGAFFSRVGDASIWDCENSPCQLQITLFDAGQETGFGTAESRVSLRRIHWPSAIDMRYTEAQVPRIEAAFSVWCVVIKGQGSGTQLGRQLEDFYLGQSDILAVMEWPYSLYLTQSSNGGLNFDAPNDRRQIIDPSFDIRTQRKLTNDEGIQACFGVRSQHGLAPAATATFRFSINTSISALWQRTLR